MNTKDPLADIRGQIDAIDRDLLRLISRRATLAGEVAAVKAANGDRRYYRPEREAEILRHIKEHNPGPLDGETIARLFREIMSACLALEQPLTVAFLGPEGTFTQAAAIKHFGHSVHTHPLDDISDIFREVEAGSCSYGVVPVENSTGGVVVHTSDAFMRSPLKIAGEVTLRIHHHLMSRETDPANIRILYSHQQSLVQCRGWLDHNLPGVERIAVGSNGQAARMAAGEAGSAAIAGESAAAIHGLRILADHIEDKPGNTTRFLVIAKEDSPPSGRDKTSLLFACRNQAGGLCQLLTPLAEHRINMTRIESRPSRRGIWDYVFYVDILGHREEPLVGKALQQLEQEALYFKVLGSYPEAVL